MVSGQADKRQAVRKARLSWKMVALIFVTAAVAMLCLIFVVVYFMKIGRTVGSETQFEGCPTVEGVIVDSDECRSEIVGTKKLDFQGMVDKWVNSVGGKAGVVIYDLKTHEIAGSYNADTKFATASIYKLFVVYEGYRLVQNGVWDKTDQAGSTGHTVSGCLDLAIRESNSVCAETLWEMMGRDALDLAVQNDFGLTEVEVGSLMATPKEIMQMMQIYYEHSEINDEELVGVMKDSFLNQPVTTYNWRQGLPSGFSDSAIVYNKVGWDYDGRNWIVYNDAAIVDFVNQERSFIVVVMTSGVDFKEIRRFGTEFEQYFYSLQ